MYDRVSVVVAFLRVEVHPWCRTGANSSIDGDEVGQVGAPPLGGDRGLSKDEEEAKDGARAGEVTAEASTVLAGWVASVADRVGG